MKRYHQLFLLLIFLQSFIACKKDFLDVTDSSLLNRESYVRDLNTMQEYLNGVYVRMNTAFESGLGTAYPDLAADNLKPLLSGTQSLIAHYAWSQLAVDNSAGLTPISADLNLDAVWRGHYILIRSCSFVIENIEKYRDQNPQRANDMLGQAYAIRAMVHFRLVNIFAQPYSFSTNGAHLGIPYVTTADITAPVIRQTVSEVYGALIKDLNNAISLLASTSKDRRIMNKTAAKGLLARTYLFKGDYNNAKTLALGIANEVPLMTIDKGYPDALFINLAVNESEVLFQLRPVNYTATANIASRFLGHYLTGSAALFAATNDIAAILLENSNDVRSKWIIPKGNSEWTANKFPRGIANETPAITLAGSSYYPPVIRSSEMSLIAAEASAKLGDEATARLYLDNIRKRADPSIQPVSASGTALIDSIYKERRKELCFEGLRMFDLQRWKLGVHRGDVHPSYSSSKDLPYPNNKAIAPIPLIDVRESGLIQNADY